MSKIDDFTKAKAMSDRIASFAKTVQDTKNADKFGAKIAISDDYLGYYGRSSTCSWGDSERTEIVKQIGIELRGLALRASERVARETEQIRRLAVEEAKSVLEEIGE